jgi:hypothetical protein
MLEKKIEKSVCDYAERKGMWQRKFTSPGRRGPPDRIFAFPRPATESRVFWIEFKATGEEPTALQLREHKKMRAKGLTVYVCDNIEQGKRIIDDELSGDALSL